MKTPSHIKQLNKRIAAAMIDAVNDPADPCELAYPAWQATHSLTNSDIDVNIISEAARRLGLRADDLPTGDDLLDYVCGCSSIKFETFAVLVINIDGRQFMVGEIDGDNTPVVREMKKPINFSKEAANE